MHIRCLALLLVVLILGLASLACSANLQITDLPQYVCPSATPRPTDTAQPTSPPTYPAYLAVNLATATYGGTGPIRVQMSAQNAGGLYIRYSGQRRTYPYFWEGSFGRYYSAGFSGPSLSTSMYTLYVPVDVYSVNLSLYADGVPNPQFLTAYQLASFPTPQAPPCCAPPPIYPTTRPTYTPYPSPTPYVRTNDYFLGDLVTTQQQVSGLQLALRLIQISSQASATLSSTGEAQSVYQWTLTIRNSGTVPYTFFPPAQMYVSVVRQADNPSAEVQGVWGPSLAAAEEAGLVFEQMTWDMQDILPGQTRTFSLAAFGPVGTAYKIAYVMDASQRASAPGDPTLVPGTNVVAWLNEINTVCQGDIAQP